MADAAVAGSVPSKSELRDKNKKKAQSHRKLRFEAPAGMRIHRGFRAVTVRSQSGEESLWWSFSERRWTKEPKGRSSSHSPCRTLKAFQRHLRRHEVELRGRTVVLVSRWIGHDVVAEAEG